MAKTKGKGKIKTVAIVLATILAVGALGGAAAHLVNNQFNPITIDGKAKTVVGFTGLTNSNGVLTYTGDYTKYNSVALDESVDEEEEATESAESATEETENSLKTVYTTKTTGEFVEVTSPLDDLYPFNQIKVVKDKYNNSFTAFPKMYISYTLNRAGYLDGVSFANYKVDDSYFISDAYLKQDGSGEYGDYFYIGCYEGSGSTEKLYSVPSATPLVNITRDEARQAARAYGTAKTYYKGYQQLDLPMYDMYIMLCCLYYKTSDIQSVWGADMHCAKVETTGSTSPIATMNGWNTRTGAAKMLGVENMTDSASEWCDAVNFEKNSIYYQSNPNNYTDTIDKTSDVVVEFERPSMSGYVELLMAGTTEKTQSIIFPAFTSASNEGYENDGYWFSEMGTVLIVGGHCGSAASGEAGLFFFSGNHDSAYSGGGLCSRLCGRTLSGAA